MATQDDVRRIAMSLPEVTEETGRFAFRVRDKAFARVWLERPKPKGRRVPNPEVIAVRVAGELDKQTLLGLDQAAFFTEPHYDGFPAVLVRLPAIEIGILEKLLLDAWRVQAPRRLVAESDSAVR